MRSGKRRVCLWLMSILGGVEECGREGEVEGGQSDIEEEKEKEKSGSVTNG